MQKEQYHTKLGIIYVESILSLMKDLPKNDDGLARERYINKPVNLLQCNF